MVQTGISLFMQREFWLEGVKDDLILRTLDSITSERGFKWFEDEACRLLRIIGYTIHRQFVVENRGDGYRGKIDIIAVKPPVLAAIELDAYVPRKKSIFKVRQVKDATMRLVYCRRSVSSERRNRYLSQFAHSSGVSHEYHF